MNEEKLPELLPKKPKHEHYPEDVDRIVKVCHDKGYTITRRTAVEIWEEHSESMAAGWLFLPDSDIQIFEIVIRYCLKL